MKTMQVKIASMQVCKMHTSCLRISARKNKEWHSVIEVLYNGESILTDLDNNYLIK